MTPNEVQKVCDFTWVYSGEKKRELSPDKQIPFLKIPNASTCESPEISPISKVKFIKSTSMFPFPFDAGIKIKSLVKLDKKPETKENLV